METVVFTFILPKKKQWEAIKFFFLKLLALTLPFYVVFLPQLHEDSSRAKIKNLWKYVITGFLIYIAGIILYILLK
jgi:hypothetical protein